MDLAREKQHVHELIERLPPPQLAAVAGLLEAMLEPRAYTVDSAPLEDEEVSELEERAAAEAREWLKHNSPIDNKEVLAEFGLSPRNIEETSRDSLK